LREANRYAYAGADPVNLVDPLGQISITLKTPRICGIRATAHVRAFEGDAVVQSTGKLDRGSNDTCDGAWDTMTLVRTRGITFKYDYESKSPRAKENQK
jgi:hypothetical protein